MVVWLKRRGVLISRPGKGMRGQGGHRGEGDGVGRRCVVGGGSVVAVCRDQRLWYPAVGVVMVGNFGQVGPGPRATTVLLCRLAERKGHDIAIRVLEWLEVNSSDMNMTRYGAAISACEEADEWLKVLVLLSSMASRRLNSNNITYDATISVVWCKLYKFISACILSRP